MESLFVPTLIVALAEIGDKTQLLALLLAARFRKPWPIIAGIVAATLANHFAAGAVGAWVASFFSEAPSVGSSPPPSSPSPCGRWYRTSSTTKSPD